MSTLQANGKFCHPVERELRGADFSGLHIFDVDFSRSVLAGADFSDAIIENCVFNYSDLSRVKFSGATFRDVSFFKCNLAASSFQMTEIDNGLFTESDCRNTRWDNAHLRGVSLMETKMDNAVWVDMVISHSMLRGANLTGVLLGNTSFNGCDGIHETRGLHRVRHLGPSILDLDTMRNCIAGLPFEFALGLGVLPRELDQLRKIFPEPVHMKTCYIYHPANEEEVLTAVKNSLTRAGFCCWSYPYDTGFPAEYEVREMFAEMTLDADFVIMLVNGESFLMPHFPPIIIDTIENEMKKGRQKLITVALDEVLLGKEALATSGELARSGLWTTDWVRYVRLFPIVDFRRRRNPKAFEKEMFKMIDIIKNPAPRSS